jgi:hypothetical protein
MSIRNVKKFCEEIGISRQTFYKYRKEGMALDDESAACEWIAANYGTGGGKNLKLNDEKKARSFDAENPPGIVVSDDDVTREDVLGTLARKRKNEKLAWGLLSEAAKERNIAKIAALTRHYNQCSDSRLKTEADLVAMQNNEKALEDKAEQLAMDVVLKTLRPLRQMLRTLPSRLAPLCNPASVDSARAVLDAEIERLFETTYIGKEKS